MRAAWPASDAGRAARLAAALVALAACAVGCRGGCGEPGPGGKRDATAVGSDAIGSLDGALAGDAAPVLDDAGSPDGGGPRLDAGAPLDAGSAAAGCPTWRTPPAAGHGWLYARAVTSTGVVLTSDVDIYVRRTTDRSPGERAAANQPCAVASYEQTAPTVIVLAAAIGFSTQERPFSPQSCVATSPCSIELPKRLAPQYYIATNDTVQLRAADDVAASDKPAFAAAAADDALARSKALGRPLAVELDRTGKATNVPALDLAIQFSEVVLRKRCDASCLDEPTLDPAVRAYLKSARPHGRPNPFELRTSPDRWERER